MIQFNVPYTLKTPTHQLEVSTFIIKTNHRNLDVIAFADEMPNFITNYELHF